ncbi:hypothetical protein [Streptomyces sp. NPDC059928]|uniref:hypothetical protein n=1 Tax=unclassified Streptomyces TaxID=2593676 RepID=UPI003662B422
MTLIEPGLSVRDGFAEGPLAAAALSRAARARTLAPAVTSAGVRASFRDGCHSAAISGLSLESAR